jgi:hypothetical protein
MNYSMTCPSPCNQVMKVDAKNDDEAISKLMVAGKAHMKESHPKMPPMSDEQMKSMLKAGMKKG